MRGSIGSRRPPHLLALLGTTALMASVCLACTRIGALLTAPSEVDQLAQEGRITGAPRYFEGTATWTLDGCPMQTKAWLQVFPDGRVLVVSRANGHPTGGSGFTCGVTEDADTYEMSARGDVIAPTGSHVAGGHETAGLWRCNESLKAGGNGERNSGEDASFGKATFPFLTAAYRDAGLHGAADFDVGCGPRVYQRLAGSLPEVAAPSIDFGAGY
jgi:hypothetical protein